LADSDKLEIQMKAKIFKFLSCLGIVFASVTLTSCSPSTFFGNNEDQELKEKDPYRQVNQQCAGIKISKDGLTTETFLSLIDCFNNDGGLKEVAELAHKLSTDELAPYVKLINENLLQNSKTLHELDVTHNDLDESGVLDKQLAVVGEILENDELFIAVLGLLKELYYKNNGFFQSPSIDEELLQTMAYLGKKIEPVRLVDTIERLSALVDSAAFDGLVAKFKGPSPAGRTWQQMVDSIENYLHVPVGQNHQALGYELIKKTANGELLPLLDPAVGNTVSELRAGIPRTASFLEVSLEKNGEIFNGLNDLFRTMDAPLNCMNGAKQIPNAVQFVINELTAKATSEAADFIKRDTMMLLASVNAVCELPTRLPKLYPTMVSLANTTAIQPGVDLIKIFNRAGETRFLINLLSDIALPTLTPILAEVRDRGALTDALLVASLLRLEDRKQMYVDLNEIIQPTAELGGKSPYQIILTALERAQPASLLRVATALPKTIESPNKFLGPLLTYSRDAILTNEAHPFLDLTRKILTETRTNQALLSSVFSIYNREDFRDAIKLISKLAKNGRLKATLRTSLDLFKPFVEGENTIIAKNPIPMVVLKRRHNMSTADLIPFPIKPEPTIANEDCLALDLSLPMDAVAAPGYEQQIYHLAKCLNSNQSHAPALQAISFLLGQKTEDGRSYWAYNVDLMKAMHFSPSQMGFLTDSWISAYDDGRWGRLMNAIPMFVSQFFHGSSDPGNHSGPVLRPLFDLAKPLMKADVRPAVKRFVQFGAKHLERDETITIAKYIDKLWDVGPEPSMTLDPTQYDATKIKNFLKEKECVTQPAALDKRMNEVIYDYRYAVDNWSFANGKPRYSWSKKDFKEIVDKNVFAKMADPSTSDPKRPVLLAMMNPTERFTLEEGAAPSFGKHYPRSYLMRWFHEKSSDYQPIQFFYPGEKTPRVRLVNTIDRMEIVLLAADFKAPAPINKNFALQFLGELGDSWGDEPERLWPAEIKAKAKRTGKNPPTIAQTVAHIYETQESFENLVGFPKIPKCSDGSGGGGGGGVPIPIPGAAELKPGLFNTRQVIDVLKDLTPKLCTNAEIAKDVCVLNANGKYEKAGLKVLRDIFFEVLYSTPEKYRIDDEFAGDATACVFPFANRDKGACAVDNNNLSIILKMTRVGMFRNIGAALKKFPTVDRSLRALSNVMVDSTVAPETYGILKTLLITDQKRELFWKVLDTVFDVIDEHNRGEGNDFAQMKQNVFYLLGLADDFKVIPPAMGQVKNVIDQYRPFLTEKISKVRSLLTNYRMSLLMRAIFENGDVESKDAIQILLNDVFSDPRRATDLMKIVKAISDDPLASEALDLADSRWDVLGDQPEYQALHLSDFKEDIKEFFFEEHPSSVGVSTARQMRLATAHLLSSGEIEQLLVLLGRDPKNSYQMLEAISHEIQAGQLQEFFKLMRRSFGTR